jgi:hypothetical protein
MYRRPAPDPTKFDIEPRALFALSARIGLPLRPVQLDVGDGVTVDLDGASDDHTVLAEICPSLGPMRGAHTRKLVADAFKLAWAGTRLNSSRLILAVVGREAHAYLRRRDTWLSAALVDNSIEIVYVGPCRVLAPRVTPPSGHADAIVASVAGRQFLPRRAQSRRTPLESA